MVVSALSRFPYLASSDYEEAVRRLHQVCQPIQDTQWHEAQLIEAQGQLCFRLSTFQRPNLDQLIDVHDDQVLETEMLEDDPERAGEGVRVDSHANEGRLKVIYDVFFSPTYQVPVLYLQTQGFASAETTLGPLDIITPTLWRPQVRELGIMGAVTLTDHPMTGLPVYFVHPCNTAEAMRAVCGDQDPGPFGYLVKWFGLVGGCVNLVVPCEVFTSSD